jgi:hypothetical protein
MQNILYCLEGGLGLLFLLTTLESVLIKNSFHTRNFFLFSTTTRVRSRLAYQENENFPSLSDLPRSHKVNSKEHTQKRKPFLLYF